MKRIFLVMLVAMVAAVSCQKSELAGTSFTGNEFEMTITANLSDGSSATRAIDNYGTGKNVTRCIMEVYYIGADGTAYPELYQRMYSAVDADTKTASFDIRLVDGQTYDFLFWADCGDTSNLETDVYYTTTSLNAVSVDYTDYNTYGDKRDAFFGSELAVKVSEQAVAFDVELRRPFGQLNVFSKFTDALEGGIADLIPTKVQYAYTTNVCNTLDVKSGIASGSETLEWAGSRNIIDDLSSTGYTHLSTDYIFAPLDESGSTQTLVDFTLTFYNAAGTEIMSNDAFVNIPIQRNYRTNVYGELMTVSGDITVEVVPAFTEPDIEVEIVTVESVSELNEFLETYTGESDVSINLTSAPAEGEEIVIPEDLSANSVEVNLAEVSSEDPIVVTAENDAYAGNVTINNNSESEMDLTVTAPNSHVTVSGSYSNLVVSSSSTTCVIVEESVVREILTVESGNVDVYGTVGEIVRSDDNRDEQTIVSVYQGGTVGSCGEGITLIKKMYLSDFVEGFVPEGTTWEILDESATYDDFAGLSTALTDSIALVFPNLKVIPELALAGCAASFSVSAPNVTTIGDYAFVACLSMTSVSLPSATTIGEAAFELCIALTSVSLPLATTIGDYAFCECKALTSVSLPLATTIGDYAFVACVSLTSVSLPSATAIGVCAFRGCPNLESVSLPSVTSLGDASFQYSGLVNLELATNENCVITYFGAILFSSEYDDDNVILHIGSANSDLVSGNTITVNNDVYGMQYYTFKEIYIDGVKSEREGLYLSDFVEGFVPEGTTWTILDESATNEDFAGLRALLVEGVEIALDFPNLKVIPNEAFYGCKAAFGFSGAAVESIEEGYYVVDESASAPQQSAPLSVNSNELELSLDNINMESGVDVMRAPQYAQTVSALYGAFAYCTNVTSVSLPEATTIGNYAFYYCEALTEVSLPEATTIEDAVFAGCSALADVSLPKAITIEISAFNTCSSLTSVSLPEATMIGGYVFNSCEALTSVSLPEATTIGYAAFAYCSVLTDASAPKAITIDDRAFGYCSDLAEISLPEATTIGMLAFYMCEALTSVSLPEATSIGAGAFISCTALTNLELATASGVVLQEMGEFIFATAEEIDGYFYLTDDSNGGNVTLNIGSANSEYISGNTITVNNDVYGMQYYTFKEIYIDGVKSEPDPEPEDDGYNSAYNSTIVVTPSMTSVSLDITIPQGVSKVYYYNATGKTAEDAKEYLLNKVESNSAYDYWNKSGVETISGLSYNTSYVLATISEAADGSYSELQSYEYTTNDIEFTSSASVSYATTYGAHSWSSSADAYSITLDVKFENGAVGYYFTELDSYFQKDYDGDGVISAIDCATSMVNNGFINSYFYYDSEGECTGSTRYAENYFVIIPVDANGAFGTPIALSKSTDESITEPEPEPEALSISMAVTELTTSSVTVEFTPSNDTDSYYAYICDEDFMTAQSEYVQIAYIGMNGTKFTGVNSLTASITSKAKRAYCIGVDDSGTSTTELYSMLCEGEVTE